MLSLNILITSIVAYIIKVAYLLFSFLYFFEVFVFLLNKNLKESIFLINLKHPNYLKSNFFLFCLFSFSYINIKSSLVAQMVKNPPAMQET